MIRPADESDRQDLKWLVLDALQNRRSARRTGDPPRKVKARVLAVAFGIRPHARTEDSRKKGLRNVVRALRADGIEIASDLTGYWLPVDAGDHADYREFLHRQAMARLAAEGRSRRSPGAAQATGQLAMFNLDQPSDNLAMAH